jgi:hypothetical protein
LTDGSDGGDSADAPVLGLIKNRPNANIISSSVFRDIGDAPWAAAAIDNFYKAGIVNGMGGNEFKPNEGVTREQFVKMLVLAFNWKTAADSNFVDVPANSWSYPFVSAAFQSGVIKGISDSEFGASSLITRQDMAVMISRALGVTGVTVRQGALEPGYDGVADYALEDVKKLASNGILYPISGSLYAAAGVSRADAVGVLFNARMLVTGQRFIPIAP